MILLAWAMAESFVDVKALCDEGKDVALYKTTDTWSLGYGGLKDKSQGSSQPHRKYLPPEQWTISSTSWRIPQWMQVESL